MFIFYVTVPGIFSLMEVYGRNSDFYIDIYMKYTGKI